MKAVSYARFGGVDVLEFTDQPEPAQRDEAVLVAVRATSINIVDIRSRNGVMWPLVNKSFPKIPGADIAGTVIAIGKAVRDFRVGDRVFGARDPFKGGGFAEKASVGAGKLAKIPQALDFVAAAAIPTVGVAALQAMRDLGKLAAGQRVLIYGASGPLGLVAVQLAKAAGAHVTAVAGSRGLDLLREFGADIIFDHTKDRISFDNPFDIVLECSGAFPFKLARRHLAPAGRFIETSPTIPKTIGSMAANLVRRQKHLMLMAAARRNDLEELACMIAAGRLRVPVAETFTFDRAVAAFRAVEQGRPPGKVVVTLDV